jgi:hypothetical protein
MHHGCGPKIRGVTSKQPLERKGDSMDIVLGGLFLLGGLALAVLLGIVLYRDPEKKAQTAFTPVGTRRDAETA